MMSESGMVVNICNPSMRVGGLRQEAHMVEASMGYVVRPCANKQNKNSNSRLVPHIQTYLATVVIKTFSL